MKVKTNDMDNDKDDDYNDDYDNYDYDDDYNDDYNDYVVTTTTSTIAATTMTTTTSTTRTTTMTYDYDGYVDDDDHPGRQQRRGKLPRRALPHSSANTPPHRTAVLCATTATSSPKMCTS